MIMAGKVLVNNQPVDKAGFLVSATDNIVLKEKDIPYVSRGGLKIEGALQALELNPEGCICLDVGAFECHPHAPGGTGQMAYVLAYDPDCVPVSFYVHFGQLLGLNLRPNSEMTAREASVEILSPGKAQVTLDLVCFLARWRDNIGQRTGPG